MFENREEAGRMLAERLKKHKLKNALVLAIPRGGVVIADEIVKQVGGELDLIIPRKIGAPSNPELAIGAVAPDRSFTVDKKIARETGATKEYIDRTVRIESIEIDRRMLKYRGDKKFPDAKNRVVVVVDDGIATGYTMKVTVEFLRKMKPKKIIVAVPVAPYETAREMEKDADEFVCLEVPEDFYAIGAHYSEFPQVSDDEVISIMKRHRRG